MNSLFKSSGIVILMGYAAFNMLNILYFYEAISTVYLPVSIAAIYTIYRLLSMLQNNSPIEQGEIIGICLLFAVTCTVLAQNVMFDFVGLDSVDTTANVTALTITSLLWFFVGAGSARFQFEDSAVIALTVVGAVVVAMGLAIDESLTIPYNLIGRESGVENVSHLTLEKHVILLLVFAYAMSSKMRPLIVVGGCVALFFMGGRTALFTFGLAGLLMSFQGNLFRNTIVAILISLACLALFWYSVLTGFIDPESAAVREILFLDGVEDDNSYNGRVALFQENLPLLADQFWIGNFGLVSESQGGFAGYIHNLLSAWQFYGFFIFVMLLFCLYYSLRKMVFAMKRLNHPNDVFGAFLLVYVVISVLIAKYVGWHLLWFALGYWLMKPSLVLNSGQRKKRRRTKKRVMSESTYTAEHSRV